jgi:hypothetical protein
MAQYPERTQRGWPAGSAADIASRRATGWRQNFLMLPLAALVVAALVTQVPPFRSFNTAQGYAAINPGAPMLHYVVIVAHVLPSVIALITVCLALWPWLRVRHPVAHRRSFLLYVFSAMPAALLILPLVYLHIDLPNDIGSYAKGTFWFASSLVAYIGYRQGDEAKRRRWLFYSFAVCISVLWSMSMGTFVYNTPAQFVDLMEWVSWIGPVLNLGIAKWWLYHTERRDQQVRPDGTTVRNLHTNGTPDGLAGGTSAHANGKDPHPVPQL